MSSEKNLKEAARWYTAALDDLESAGLPDITPDVAFTVLDAESCIAHANNILNVVKSLIKLS